MSSAITLASRASPLARGERLDADTNPSVALPGRKPRAGAHDLPMPPPRRRLNREQAAAYCGISPTQFDIEVKAERYPRPIAKGQKGGRKVWDVKLLDAALDREAGLSGAPTEHARQDPYSERLPRRGDYRTAGH